MKGEGRGGVKEGVRVGVREGWGEERGRVRWGVHKNIQLYDTYHRFMLIYIIKKQENMLKLTAGHKNM